MKDLPLYYTKCYGRKVQNTRFGNLQIGVISEPNENNQFRGSRNFH
jgi:hypothetical protein